MVISSMTNVAHLSASRSGNQIQIRFQGTQIHYQLLMLPEKTKSLESYLLLSGICLEKTQDSHPMWFQTPACCSLKSCLTGCPMKRSQTHEHVRQDGEQLYSGEYLHFGRDRAQVGGMSDFQIFSSFGFH